MISIGESLSELEKCHHQRTILLDCYLAAIQNLAHYTIEFDDETTGTQRRYLADLAQDVSGGSPGSLQNSRSTLRGLLRDYRDKANQYLGGLREELAGSARALEEILTALSESDGDHQARLRSSLRNLREAAASAEGVDLRSRVLSGADAIDQSLEELRKQQQLTICQFQMEIHMLHRRIDALQAAASIDNLTQLYNRAEMETRIRSAPEDVCLLLIKVSGGFRQAALHYGLEVSRELTAAFARRLQNYLPPTTVIGRWGQEEFIVMLPMSKPKALDVAKLISEHVSGSYACLLGGKAVRPTLQVSTGVLERAGSSPEQVIEHAVQFFV